MTATVLSAPATSDYTRTVRRAAESLRDGGIVVLPTETVYGAAASLRNPGALRRLRQATRVPESRPLVVHLARPEHAQQFTGEHSPLAARAVRKLWPGPIALVMDVAEPVREQVSRRLGIEPGEIYDGATITLRCPDYPVAADVLGEVDSPVVMRRASSGDDPETRIDPAWLDAAALVLDYGPTRFARPSTVVRLHEDHYEVLRQGVYDQRIIERLMKTTILYVCSGNTCRSPMAEAITRTLLASQLGTPESELEKKGVAVLSAGAFAFPGSQATAVAVQAAGELGASLAQHRSRALTVELINQADVIYTMSENHRRVVLAMVPSAASKTHTLDPSGDVDDPIGGDLPLYQSLARQLKSLIEKRLAENPVA